MLVPVKLLRNPQPELNGRLGLLRRERVMLTGWLFPIEGRLRAEHSFQPTDLETGRPFPVLLPLNIKRGGSDWV